MCADMYMHAYRFVHNLRANQVTRVRTDVLIADRVDCATDATSITHTRNPGSIPKA